MSLANQTLTVTTILNAPYCMLRESSKTKIGNDRFEGYIVDLIDELSKMLGFKYKFKLVDDNAYGVKNESGYWNGLIGINTFQIQFNSHSSECCHTIHTIISTVGCLLLNLSFNSFIPHQICFRIEQGTPTHNPDKITCFIHSAIVVLDHPTKLLFIFIFCQVLCQNDEEIMT